MTIKLCKCGKPFNTKTVLKVSSNVWVLAGVPYRMLWFTCPDPACFSTGIIKKPLKPAQSAKNTAA